MATKTRDLTAAGKKLNVVTFVHGHPDIQAGGGEVAAYNLFRGYSEDADCSAWFISWCGHQNLQSSSRQTVVSYLEKKNEYLFFDDDLDWFSHRRLNAAPILNHIVPLLRKIKPDVFHFHHFIGFGLGIFPTLKSLFPTVPIVFTLHEFLSICQRDGQMLTSPDNRLCSRATPFRCFQCNTNRTLEDHFLRERWVKHNLSFVDWFVSPSEFLRRRYVDWGIDPARISVIENGQDIDAAAGLDHDILDIVSAGRGRRSPNVFGYFGQLNPYKGIDILLAAFAALLEEHGEDSHLHIYGTMNRQSAAFQAEMSGKIKSLHPYVTYFGAYHPHEVLGLMSKVDWVVIPSIWWENSPIVIEEAIIAKRPIIASNIGGMKEKVEHGRFGLNFRVGDPKSLSEAMGACSGNQALWDRLTAGMRPVLSIEGAVDQHKAVFRRLLGEAAAPRAVHALG